MNKDNYLEALLDRQVELLKDNPAKLVPVLMAIERIVSEDYERQINNLIPEAVRQANEIISKVDARLGGMIAGTVEKTTMAKMSKADRKRTLELRSQWDREFTKAMRRLAKKKKLR